MYTVLLSGGSGKRLWPLSNDLRSKQYIKVVKGVGGQPQSMIQRVWSQLEIEGLDKSTIITAGEPQVEIIKSQLGEQVEIALEPSKRNTFPAIALSCAFLVSRMNAKPSDTVVVLPVDPFTEQQYFNTISSLESVLDESGAQIVLMGATPTYDSSKYGYILPETDYGTYSTVRGFCEKPSEVQAKALIEQGAIWNCGVFCFKIGYIMDCMRSRGLPCDYDSVYCNYEKFPKISFDYEIVEKCPKISVVRFGGQWKDLGTWNTLTEEMGTPLIGNCVMSESCVNTNIINELEIPVVVIGTRNVVVVASADGILVSDKAESSYMKDYIKDFGEFPMYEERRWGSLKVIDISCKDEVLTMTRRVNLKGNMNSSLHFHELRDEIWTVLTGEGEMRLDGMPVYLKAGDSIRIPKNSYHAIRAITDMDIIEIQIGLSMGSADITREMYDWEEIIKFKVL